VTAAAFLAPACYENPGEKKPARRPVFQASLLITSKQQEQQQPKQRQRQPKQPKQQPKRPKQQRQQRLAKQQRR